MEDNKESPFTSMNYYDKDNSEWITLTEEEMIPAPSTLEWELEDVSKSDAGRTEDGVMNKNLLGQCVKLKLSWDNITTDVASKVLRAFNLSEYIQLEYLDPMAGYHVFKEFYVGNRTAPLYNSTLGLWSNVSFNIIERNLNIFDKDEGYVPISDY